MSDDLKLYAVYLGGEPEPPRMGEDHETVFVVAKDIKDARSAARKKWRGNGRAHIDAVAELDQVDGFHVSLTQGGHGDQVVVDRTYVE